MTAARRRSRIEESVVEAERLAGEITAWIAHRHQRDPYQQYQTQLRVLESELLGALSLVESKLTAIDPQASPGTVYATCRDNDYRRSFVHRMYEYYRTKFDQRDGPDGDVLRAADEVVWSCYSEAFSNAGLAVGPTPLPYLEARFSPVATPRVDPPPDLDNTADQYLIGALRALPVPLISLPPTCAHHPWWMIHLAHETGHHVQYDLGEGSPLISGFRSVIQETVTSVPGAAVEAPQQWAEWSMELFADLFAVLAIGPWAAWSIAELESTVEQDLIVDRPLYPPPVVRMGFLRAATPAGCDLPASESLSVAAGLDDFEVPDNVLGRHFSATFGLAAPVAGAAADAPLGDHGSVCDLTGWDLDYFRPGGEVATWRDRFTAGNEPLPEEDRRSARLALAGAVAAWAGIAAVANDEQRKEQREELAVRVKTLIPKCHHAGVRSAATPAAGGPAAGALAGILAETNPEKLR